MLAVSFLAVCLSFYVWGWHHGRQNSTPTPLAKPAVYHIHAFTAPQQCGMSTTLWHIEANSPAEAIEGLLLASHE